MDKSAANIQKTEINKDPVVQDDDELDDLDDLLDEFADDILSKQPGSTVNTEHRETDTAAEKQTTSESNEAQPPIENIDNLIKDLNIEDPETKKQFEELVQQFSAQNDDSDNTSKNFDDVMKDTMSRLKNSGKDIDDDLKKGGAGDDLISQLLSGLGGGDGDMNMSNLLMDMLEQLSSKEVLYEPIKELNSKFPQYLEEKKGVISDEQHSNYSKQYEITCGILEIFDAQDYSDDDKAKKESVNTLLESLQELGQPPSELVGDTEDFLGLGGTNPGLDNLDFDDKDLPPDLEKQLDENCKQS